MKKAAILGTAVAAFGFGGTALAETLPIQSRLASEATTTLGATAMPEFQTEARPRGNRRLFQLSGLVKANGGNERAYEDVYTNRADVIMKFVATGKTDWAAHLVCKGNGVIVSDINDRKYKPFTKEGENRFVKPDPDLSARYQVCQGNEFTDYTVEQFAGLRPDRLLIDTE